MWVLHCTYLQYHVSPHLSTDRRSVVPVWQLVCSNEAHVLATLLEGFDAHVFQDILHPYTRPHRVRYGRRSPREPVTRRQQILWSGELNDVSLPPKWNHQTCA